MIPHVEGIWHLKYDQTRTQSAIFRQELWNSQTPPQKILGIHQPVWICKYAFTGYNLRGEKTNKQKKHIASSTYNEYLLVINKTGSIFHRFYFSRCRAALFLQISNNTICITRTFVLLSMLSSISQNFNCGETLNLKFSCELFVYFFIGVNFC